MGARFLLTYPPPRAVKWRDKAVDEATEDRLASMFDWLLGIPLVIDEETGDPDPRLLWLTPDAMELWIAFHNEHSAEQAELHGDLSAAWAKLTGYAARLSLVCQLASWASGDNSFELPTKVGVEAILSGITLANWFSNETKRIYAVLEETDEEREIRKLVEYIQRRGGAITERDLSRGPRRYKTVPALAEQDLQYLVGCGAGKWQTLPTSNYGGRPTRLFRLSPEFAGDETPSILEENGGFGSVATHDESENGEGEWEG